MTAGAAGRHKSLRCRMTVVPQTEQTSLFST